MPKLAPARPFNAQLFSDITPETVKWLWYPYIPYGMVTNLGGDPGVGKSWIACKIAADLSSGRALPGMRSALPPQKILMASAEDSPSIVLAPRLRALDANLGMVYSLSEPFTLTGDGLARLRETMRTFTAMVVFIDPIVAYFAAGKNMNASNEVREVMQGLKIAAEETGAAVIIVRHLRKGDAEKAIYKGSGSIDFTAAVRSELQAEEAMDGTKILHHIKSNIGPKGDSITFETLPGEEIGQTGTYTPGSFVWGSTIPMDMLKKGGGPRGYESQRAQAFIREVLKNGPVPALEVKELAEAEDIGWQTLKNNKKGIARSVKQGMGEWVWELIEPEV